MLALAAAAPLGTSNHTQLALAAVLGIASVVLLITWAKMHPFLALIVGSGVLGSVAGMAPAVTVTSFQTGVGSTFGAVGLLVALGAMIGGLLTNSGGTDRLVSRVVSSVPVTWLPWAMAGLAALIGIPLFFEVGIVLLVSIVLLVARRSGTSLIKVGIPALAGLSVLHGFIPPHPGPLAAIAVLHADLGLTLLFGLIIAVPAVVLAGPCQWRSNGSPSPSVRKAQEHARARHPRRNRKAGQPRLSARRTSASDASPRSWPLSSRSSPPSDSCSSALSPTSPSARARHFGGCWTSSGLR